MGVPRLVPMALGALVVFAAGVGVGLVLASGPFTAGPGSPRQESAPELQEGRPDTEDAPRRVRTSRSEASRTARPGVPDGVLPDGELPEVDLPEMELGDGRITGSVRTNAGEPVAGVRIWAERVADEDGHAGEDDAPEEDFRRLLEREARRLSHRFASRRGATSGADGSYELDGLGEGAYEVQGHLDGWEISPVNREHAQAARPGSLLDFRAGRVASVGVVVRLPDGSEPERADLAFDGLGGAKPQKRVWRRGRSTVRLPAGRYRATATAGEDASFRSAPQEVALEDGGENAPLTFDLAGRPGIRGRVVLPSGERGIHIVTVYALRYLASEPPSLDRLQEEGETSSTGRGDGFRFVFNDLEPGKYLLGATRHSARIPAAETVFVGQSMEVRTIELPPLARAEYVHLRVFGPDGTPLHASALGLGTGFAAEGYSSTTHGGVDTLEQPDGSIWVFHHSAPLDRRDNDKAEWYLLVESEEHGKRRVRYDRDDSPEVTIQFEHPATLTVSVTNAVGSPILDDLRIGLRRPETNEDAVQLHGDQVGEKAVEAEGQVAFDALLPGEHQVRLLLDESGRKRELATAKAVLASGENSATIRIPELHSLRVVAYTAAIGSTVWLQKRRQEPEGDVTRWDWVTRGKLAGGHQHTFENIPAGVYLVTLRRTKGAEKEEKKVRVPAQSEVRFGDQ